MILTDDEQAQLESSPLDILRTELRTEIETAAREMKEITMMLEQSQVEVNKLAQKNATITAKLQQVQSQFDSMPRSDIRTAYDSALDGQQRLFVMRGQIDKLTSDRAHIEKSKTLLEHFYQALESTEAPVTGRPAAQKTSSAVETIEMVIQAQEAERQRLARQMHDEPAQALSNFILQTEIAMRLFDLYPDKAKAELANLRTTATSTFQKVRDFIFELRPMMLDDLGLTPTLTRYIEALKEQSGIEIRLNVSGMEQRLEPYLEVMIFRAVQEMVGNAVRHSGGSSIKVVLVSTDSDVKVSVEDNGKGFDTEMALLKGMGLKLIRDRVEMLGGRIDIDSIASQGSRISFEIPAKRSKVFA